MKALRLKPINHDFTENPVVPANIETYWYEPDHLPTLLRHEYRFLRTEGTTPRAARWHVLRMTAMLMPYPRSSWRASFLSAEQEEDRKAAVEGLTDDGDVIELHDGRSVRLRFKPDDTNPFEEYDTYGKIEPFPTNTYGYDRHGMRTNFRPDGFDGNAEKLWPPQNSDPVWWQPPADVKRTDPHFPELRDHVKDLIAFGMQGVVIELLDTEPDAHHQPVVRKVASLWGLEPFIDKDYLATVVGELIDEIMEDNDG